MEFNFKQTQTDDDSLKKYSNLLSKVFPGTSKYTFDFLKWQYRDNPLGEVVGFDAFYNNDLVAHYVTIPTQFEKEGVDYQGLLSLNTATDSKFQGKGLFTNLASKTYELGLQKNYQFVIGVANQNSTPGFIKKLGFTLIAPLDAYIYLFSKDIPNNVSAFFKSRLPEDSILWRTNNPSNEYLFANNKIYSKTDNKLIRAILSKEKLFTSAHSLPICFKLSIGLNNAPNTNMKFKIPDKLKPSPLNLIFKPLKSLNFNLDSRNIYFELLDFDAY
jgi:hypothetical protein